MNRREFLNKSKIALFGLFGVPLLISKEKEYTIHNFINDFNESIKNKGKNIAKAYERQFYMIMDNLGINKESATRIFKANEDIARHNMKHKLTVYDLMKKYL